MVSNSTNVQTRTPLKRSPTIDFPLLHEYAGKFFRLIEPVFSNGLRLNELDHFGFMALCFIHKQIEHARSLGLLIDARQYSDGAILARVMLEGYIYILWARLDKADRALAWRSHALICDYETLLLAKSRGEIVDQEKVQYLHDRIAAEAKRFLTKGALKVGVENQKNPYQRDWNIDKHGKRVELAEMVVEIGDPEIKRLYNDLSQLGHWTIRGFGSLVTREFDSLKIKFDDDSFGAKACAVCIQTLGGTARAAAEHFDLPIQLQIDSLFDEYLSRLGLTPSENSQLDK